MTSEIYFPEHRHLLAKATIRRERLLPDYTTGDVLVSQNTRVGLRDMVVRGSSSAPYVLINAAQELKLKKSDDLMNYLRVGISEDVVVDELLAGSTRRRGRKVLSPIRGKVIDVVQGQIILQQEAEPLEIEAGMNGVVVGTQRGRGVVIEASGAVIQGIWGNGRRTIGTLQFEPPDGMENIYGDAIDTKYRGSLVITRRPLRRVSLQVVLDQGFVGVIAPSMEPEMLDLALKMRAAVLLTEGFGSEPMSNTIFQFLQTLDGRQATLDAVLPAPLETRRPELIVNVPLDPGERPPPPNLNSVLKVGWDVRLARGKFAGMLGRVIDLPKGPVSLENGLKVPCVQVELVTGGKWFVPLANIEVLGS